MSINLAFVCGVLITSAPLAHSADEPGPAVDRKGPALDLHHPPKMGEAFYPSESKRRREQGKCVMDITVASTGEILRVEVTQSTGFPLLDKACVEAMKTARYFPATEGGKPVAAIAKFTINWRL